MPKHPKKAFGNRQISKAWMAILGPLWAAIHKRAERPSITNHLDNRRLHRRAQPANNTHDPHQAHSYLIVVFTRTRSREGETKPMR